MLTADYVDHYIQTADSESALLLFVLSYTPLDIAGLLDFRYYDQPPGPFGKGVSELAKLYVASQNREPNVGTFECQVVPAHDARGPLVLARPDDHGAPRSRSWVFASTARATLGHGPQDVSYTYYERLLELAGDNVRQAATIGGVSANTLYRYLLLADGKKPRR